MFHFLKQNSGVNTFKTENIHSLLWNMTTAAVKVMTFCPLVHRYRMRFIKYHFREIAPFIIPDLKIWMSDFARANSSLKITSNNHNNISMKIPQDCERLNKLLFYNVARISARHYTITVEIMLIRKWGDNLKFENTEYNMCIMLTV